MMGDTCAAMSVQAAVERSPDELPLLEGETRETAPASGCHPARTPVRRARSPGEHRAEGHQRSGRLGEDQHLTPV